MKKEKILKIILLLGDFALMYVSLYFTLILRNKGLIFNFRNFADSFSVLYILWLPFIYALDFYEINYFKKSSLYRLSIFGFLATFLGLGYFYLRPQLIFTPKTILILNIIIYIIIFYIWRKVFYKLIIKNKKEKVVVVGFPKNIDKIYNQIKDVNFEILAIFIPNSLVLFKSVNYNFLEKKVKVITLENDFKNFVEKENIDFIIFTNDFYNNQLLSGLSENFFLKFFNKTKYINYNDFYELVTKKVCLDNFSEVLFLEKASLNDNRVYFILKRVLDLSLGLLFFMVYIILFLFIALAIKIDSKGSIFYKQKRVGQNRKIFTVYKFRTMQENDSQHKEIWREKKENQITRVGYFLRRFHLDELPQSISILKGSLSFVGPRPEWIKIDEIFQKDIPFYSYRYLAKPGFTGFAQINFKPSNSVEEAKEKFEYDLYYMKNKSIILDVEIVLKTLRLLIHKH
jgi:exopolysaccharide biosynthesis polyprenyl glycosylphosphotransferase